MILRKRYRHGIKTLAYVSMILMVVQPVYAFKPTAERGHAGMVRRGMEAITYVTTKGDSLKFSKRAILEARTGNESVDAVFGELSVPSAHFDNELLPEGAQRLIDLKTTIITHLQKNPPDGATARNDLGRALHTLQDFYAHSNYVNDPGPSNTTFSSTLGRGTLTRLASTTATCVDDVWDATLTGSGLTDLTSGYFDFLSAEPPAGKCAHGVIPGAGIHKDAPGRQFYEMAEDCAIGGTTDYVKQIITDSRISANETAIRAFLDVKGSLGFVIDDTGSMGTVIEGVKTAVTQIVNHVKEDPDLKPDKYVLVTFGDPNVGTPTSTSSESSLLGMVDAISVGGGDDCPELSMTGLMRAIDECSEGSKLYLFTDASAKDSSLSSNVLAKALAKKITINAALTGSCSPIDEAYKTICSGTGGQWLLVNHYSEDIADYFNLVEPELTGDLQSLLIAEGALGSSATEFTIPVDSTMSTLVVSVNIGSDSYGGGGGTVTLTRPDNSNVKSDDDDVVLTDLVNGSVINVTDPAAGNWKLSITGVSGDDYSASVKGNSSLVFQRFYFAEKQDYRPTEGSLFPMSGQPLMGETQTAIANVYGDYTDASFELVSQAGVKLLAIDMAEGDEEVAEDDYLGTFDLPTESFRVLVKGKDKSGKSFMRVFPTVYLGQGVQVSILSNDAEMVAGNTFTAKFTVKNIGPSDTFTISAADSYGYVSSVSPSSVTLNTDSSEEIEVEMSIPVSAPSVSTTLTVVAQSTTDTDIQNSALLIRTIQGDTDGDGLSDTMEKGQTGSDATYDGNGDGTPDYQQQQVGSLYTNGTGHYLTVSITGTGNFENLKAISNPSASDTPTGISFPFELFSFDITGLSMGQSTSVRFYLPSSADSFYLYGPASSGGSSSWYTIGSATGNDNTVLLTIEDGEKGDNDLLEDGTVSVVGGPSLGDENSGEKKKSDSGGCFISGMLP